MTDRDQSRRRLLDRSAAAVATAAAVAASVAMTAAATVAATPTRRAPVGGRSTPLRVAPSRAAGSTVARIVVPTFARWRLTDQRHGRTLGVMTAWTGEPQQLLVLGERQFDGRMWLHLQLANRPAGSRGWVRASDVALSRTYWWIDVSRGRRRVGVYDHGRLVRRFRAVVGKPSTPTPAGLAAVYERDRQPDPEAFDGAWVLQLTALSAALPAFDGGPGRIGLHGRGRASLVDPLGSARSHGCVRVDNSAISWIAARVSVGTPVDIR